MHALEAEERAAVYAEATNPVALEAVRSALPADGSGSVLDIGCASGGLLGRLEDVARLRCGVELNPVAAATASRHADAVHCGSVPDEDCPFERRSFDVVVLADVLEHLADPVEALQWATSFARPGGAVVISLPNVAFAGARVQLLAGRWPRHEAGLFDRTHLHWYTRTSAIELVQAAGLGVKEVRPIAAPQLTMWIPALQRLPRPMPYGVDRATAPMLAAAAKRWPTMWAYQLAIVGVVGEPEGTRLFEPRRIQA